MSGYPETGKEIYFDALKLDDCVIKTHHQSKYVLERKPINSDGASISTVYKAYDLKNKQFVVLKTSPPPDGVLPDFLGIETLTMAMLNSPDFPAYINFHRSLQLPGQPEPIDALVTEYIPHPSLDTVMRESVKSGKTLPLGQIAQIISSASQMLSRLYQEKGVIIKDLKPEHLLISEDKVTTLLDLGGSSFTTDKSDPNQEYASYTPRYISPEGLVNRSNMDQRHYVFVLGIILYELLTGSWPYGPIKDNLSKEEIIPACRHILRAAPTPLEAYDSLTRRLSTDEVLHLQSILSCALAKNPNDRYDNPTDLAENFASAIEYRHLTTLKLPYLQHVTNY